jgi:hypothetical protein
LPSATKISPFAAISMDVAVDAWGRRCGANAAMKAVARDHAPGAAVGYPESPVASI